MNVSPLHLDGFRREVFADQVREPVIFGRKWSGWDLFGLQMITGNTYCG